MTGQLSVIQAGLVRWGRRGPWLVRPARVHARPEPV